MMRYPSPFPDGFLGFELYHGEQWHDALGDVDAGGASTEHGIRREGGTADVSRTRVTLDNADGRYSARNPTSPLYGSIGRNTPARVRLDLGAPWLDLDGVTADARAEAPDAAALTITGDLDLRWEGYRDDWGSDELDLIGKYTTAGNQREYSLRVAAGVPLLYWSADGTAVRTATATVALPAWAGRVAIRVVLDVDNDAGGCTVTFHHAGRIDGTWVQLGEPVTAAGATSVFDSTAPLIIGGNPATGYADVALRVYGWEVRDGIDGDAVSSRSLATSTAGAWSVVDDQGNVFTLSAGASLSNRHVLAVGEISEWPITWGRRGEALTEVEASGPTRRLGQGASPLSSALHRGVLGLDIPARAYWPCEDTVGATALAAASLGTRPMAISGAPVLAAYEGFACSEPIPTLNDSRWTGTVPAYAGTGEIAVRFLVNFPAAGMSNTDVVASVYTAGTLARVDLQWTTAGGLRVLGYDADGTLTHTGGTLGFGAVDVAWRLGIELAQDGADVTWGIWALSVGDDEGGGEGTFTSCAIGRCTRVVVNPGKGCADDLAIGHVSVQSELLIGTWGLLWREVGAWTGEQADARIARLAAENGVVCTVRGAQGEAIALGEQRVETLLDLLTEAARSEGGILHDDPARLGLRYRTLRSMCDQPAVEIDYTDNLVIPFEPVDDDALLRNRVMITRAGGSSSVAELATGSLSTADVGVYDEQVTLSLGSDELTAHVAAWRVHLGTWDEARYPALGVDLAHPSFLADGELTRDLLQLEVGDRLVINDPPAWLPPDAVDVVIIGRSIDIAPLHVKIRWVCVPARPMHVMHWGAPHRWDGQGTELATAMEAERTLFDGSVCRSYDAGDVTGDLEVRVKASLTDWTPAARTTLIAKYLGTGNQRSWRLQVLSAGDGTAGALRLYWSNNGSASLFATSTVATGITNGEVKWVRVTLDVNNGAGGNDVTFYLSDDGVTWVQLGAAVTQGFTTSIFDSSTMYQLGASDAASVLYPLSGAIHRVRVLDGIGGDDVVPVDPQDWDEGYAGAGSGTTSEAVTSTVAAVSPPDGVGWVHDDGDYDVIVDGERMTVTAVAGDALTMARSVNGVVKAHDTGAGVSLADPSFWGL